MVKLMNGSEIEVQLAGNPDSKTIMLPIAKKTVYGEEAEKLKMWGVDPVTEVNILSKDLQTPFRFSISIMKDIYLLIRTRITSRRNRS